jgi:chromosome partitioning protein
MLQWLRRFASPTPRNELVQGEILATTPEEKVEHLVNRLDQPAKTVLEFVPTRHDANPGKSFPPTTHIIAVAAQKGGAGKTTIAAHLAVQALAMAAGPVILADTDPQRSLTQWWRARNDDALALATMTLEELAVQPAGLRRSGAAVAIIDTPPALTTSIETVISVADLVIIPARPSPHDLRAVGATVELTRKAGKPFIFVVNAAAPRAKITAEAVAALSEHGRVAPTILYQRTDFAASMIDGRTVMETAPKGRSAHEVADLWTHIYAQLSLREAA